MEKKVSGPDEFSPIILKHLQQLEIVYLKKLKNFRSRTGQHVESFKVLQRPVL